MLTYTEKTPAHQALVHRGARGRAQHSGYIPHPLVTLQAIRLISNLTVNEREMYVDCDCWYDG